jgi:two-component system, response regulator / RNA-binding antiterminator
MTNQDGALRVMLIDGDDTRAAMVEQALREQGHRVLMRLADNADLLAHVARLEPDIIIADMDSPDRDSLESMRTITRERPRPIVMFAHDGDTGMIAEAVRAGVSAYVVDGLNPSRLKPIMDVAVARFREFQTLRAELEDTRNRLEERKLVERAKGVLMQGRGMSEEEAYRALRRMAMDRNLRIGEAARHLIAAAALLGHV